MAHYVKASSSRGKGVLKRSHFSGPLDGGGLFGKKGGKIKFVLLLILRNCRTVKTLVFTSDCSCYFSPKYEE